jgi:ketosteroid isomerase-like protein
MTSENVEVVRRWLEAFNRWDGAGFIELWDPECEFFTLTGSRLAGAPYRGHDGLRRYCEERAEVWAELRIETDELREVDETIVAIGRLCGRGLASGVEVEHGTGLIFDLRGGLFLRVRSYPDGAGALEAAKLAT